MNVFYCFSLDLLGNEQEEELILQFRFAKEIKREILCDTETGLFYDSKQQLISVWGKCMFIRTDYDHYLFIEQAAVKAGATLLENSDDRDRIQNWALVYQPKRFLKLFSLGEIFADDFEEKLVQYLDGNSDFFIKSKVKGFSKIISLQELPSLKSYCEVHNLFQKGRYECMISEVINIVADGLGTKEVRFFVLNGELKNASRYLHSLSHTDYITDAFWLKAEEIKTALSQKDFPVNYVLDLAEICDKGKCYIDIVEINPVSTAMCYVMNSIFTQNDIVLEGLECQAGFGAEYCYDFQFHPYKYDLYPHKGKSYTYYVESASLP